MARESTLVLQATYHPNWHAVVDGVAAEPVMVMPSYVGVRVAPGPHHVRLEYRPRPPRGSLMIVGLLTLLLLGLAERWRIGRRAPTGFAAQANSRVREVGV